MIALSFQEPRRTSRGVEKVPMMAAAAEPVRDSRTILDAGFSCREVNRFFGIELNWTMVGQIA